MEFYILKEPYDFWGDYSHYLMHGMAAPKDMQKDGQLLLYRTGPYIPPITFPGIGDVVITDEFKRKLEESELKCFSFRPVIKQKIVHLDWHTWDKAADDPPVFPKTGEPEDYIYERSHSPELAERIGDLWEVVVKPSARVKKVQSNASLTGLDVYLITETWNGDDIFRAHEVLYVYLSKKAKDWLKENAAEFVSIEEAKIK